MRQNIIIVMLAYIIYLLWRRDAQPAPAPTVQATVSQTPPTPRPDRTLEELSPAYAESVKQNRTIYDFPSSEVYKFIRAIVHEFIQPDLTPLEKSRVSEQLTKLFYYGRRYDEHREKAHEQQTDSWLDQIGESHEEGE